MPIFHFIINLFLAAVVFIVALVLIGFLRMRAMLGGKNSVARFNKQGAIRLAHKRDKSKEDIIDHKIWTVNNVKNQHMEITNLLKLLIKKYSPKPRENMLILKKFKNNYFL